MAYGLNLPGDTDAAAMAAEIVRRAAAYRLACEPGMEPEVCARLDELAAAQRIEPDRGKPDKATWFDLPAPWVVGEESARFAPGSSVASRTPATPEADPEVQAPIRARFCTQCGSIVEAGDAFCASCGRRLQPSGDTACEPASEA